jgi:subtilisin family serine protease
MKNYILVFVILFTLSACGGGGGGGASSWTNDINNVPTCSDTGTSYQTNEYYGMSASNGLSRVCASTAYANGATGGDNIKIAVIDTGFSLTSGGNNVHLEFGSYNQSLPNGKVVLVTGSDAANQGSTVNDNDNIPDDNDGHGTHVAGIIGAQKTGYNMHGVAYDAILYPLKMMDPYGVRWNASAWAFYRALINDVDIANMSWGRRDYLGVGSSSCNSYTSCKATLDSVDQSYTYMSYMATGVSSYDGNIISVWAAGNDGESNPGIYAGSCIYDSNMRDLCVIVANIGTDGKIYTDSNRCGVAAAYCISAPGTSIQSPVRGGSELYATYTGTSMAAPMVAGGLALIKQKHSSLTNQQVVDRLFATAVDHDIYSQSSIYGHGLMDIGAATSAIGSLQTFSGPINNLDSSNSLYTELNQNSFFSSGAFNSSLILALKDKTMEVYDSFDRANFSVYLDGFFKNDHIQNRNSIDNHLNNLLLTDDNEVSKITKFGKLSFNNRDKINRFLFTSFDERVNIGNNTSANTFFNQSKQSFGISTPLTNNKLYNNPYFYDGEQNLSLSLNGDYFSSELFLDNKGTNFGYAINLQPTSKNYLDNDKYGDIEVTFGSMFEKNKILNSFSTGAFSTNELSNTKFARLKYNHSVDDLNLFANINFGSSEINSNNNSYIGNTNSILTRSYAFGLIKNNFLEHNNKFAFIISQPQKVIEGYMKLTVPINSNSDREVTYTDYDLNLASSVTEMNYDLFYIMKLTPDNSLYFNFTHIDNPNHDASLKSHNNVSLVYKKFF